ncbi:MULTISPECIES: hypothetical protein [unclassified Methanoculleus]|uniref:Uncharacterized protein n=1 Tax=Methanoculleus palmolei TaxID=72612 RepID=A0ABD8A754_9EURY|nr:hypothetical protein [Methanoculleus sp. UBA377]WOX55375.1 hypothetical protein R6Y95_07855 [Methanoculleus palmolei]
MVTPIQFQPETTARLDDVKIHPRETLHADGDSSGPLNSYKYLFSHCINDYYSGEKSCKFSSTLNLMGNGGARAPAHRGT